MAREILYQYNGKASLRDEPVFDAEETIPIPRVDEVIGRRGTHFRVQSVTKIEAKSSEITKYVVDLAPIYPQA